MNPLEVINSPYLKVIPDKYKNREPLDILNEIVWLQDLTKRWNHPMHIDGEGLEIGMGRVGCGSVITDEEDEA